MHPGPIVSDVQGEHISAPTDALGIHHDAPNVKENGVDKHRPVCTIIRLSVMDFLTMTDLRLQTKLATNAERNVSDVGNDVSDIARSRPVVSDVQGELKSAPTNALGIHHDGPKVKENGAHKNRPVSTAIYLSVTDILMMTDVPGADKTRYQRRTKGF